MFGWIQNGADPDTAPSDSQILAAFSVCLRHAPIGEHGFRAAVNRAVGRLPGLLGEVDGVFIDLPIGAPDYRIVSFSRHDRAPLVVHRVNGRLVVKPLPKPKFDDLRPTVFGVSEGRVLAVFSTGGSGTCIEGDVYAPKPHGWRCVQTVANHYSELSMQGYNLKWFASGHPRSLELSFTDHLESFGIFNGSHFSPGLKFSERWRFSDGRIRRTVFHRVATPTAALFDLSAAARRHRRATFDGFVARSVRARAWLCFVGGTSFGIYSNEPQSQSLFDPDDTRTLVVCDNRSDEGTYWRLHFEPGRRHWILTSVTRVNGPPEYAR